MIARPRTRKSAFQSNQGGLRTARKRVRLAEPRQRETRGGALPSRKKRGTACGGVSSRQSCESCEVKVLVPPIACSRADSISDACEGNDARSARTYKSLGCPVSLTCSGRNDLGGKQTVRDSVGINRPGVVNERVIQEKD